MTYSAEQLEAMAGALEASGDYRVVRRLKPRHGTTPPPGVAVRYGLVVDVETTGLDSRRHEIIELAMTPFSYGLDGTVFMVGESFQALRQPSEPISPEITAITGITDAMVEGQVVDLNAVARFWAEHSPYELKDTLKARGYRWNGDPGPLPRAWYIDVLDGQQEAELHFLKAEIYRREIDLLVRRIDAHDRFSDRV